MKCPKGSKVSISPRNITGSCAKEALMPRAQKFKVVKIEKKDIEHTYATWGNPNDIIPATVITLEYIK